MLLQPTLVYAAYALVLCRHKGAWSAKFFLQESRSTKPRHWRTTGTTLHACWDCPTAASVALWVSAHRRNTAFSPPEHSYGVLNRLAKCVYISHSPPAHTTPSTQHTHTHALTQTHACIHVHTQHFFNTHGVHIHTCYRCNTCIWLCGWVEGAGEWGGGCVFAYTEAWSTVLLLARRHWTMHKPIKYTYASQCTVGSSLWLFHHFVGWLRKRTLVAVNRASFLLAMDQFHWP